MLLYSCYIVVQFQLILGNFFYFIQKYLLRSAPLRFASLGSLGLSPSLFRSASLRFAWLARAFALAFPLRFAWLCCDNRKKNKHTPLRFVLPFLFFASRYFDFDFNFVLFPVLIAKLHNENYDSHPSGSRWSGFFDKKPVKS